MLFKVCDRYSESVELLWAALSKDLNREWLIVVVAAVSGLLKLSFLTYIEGLGSKVSPGFITVKASSKAS